VIQKVTPINSLPVLQPAFQKAAFKKCTDALIVFQLVRWNYADFGFAIM
jgi:hypothetical protein